MNGLKKEDIENAHKILGQYVYHMPEDDFQVLDQFFNNLYENKDAYLVSALENLEIAATGCGVPHPQERKILHEAIHEARKALEMVRG